MNHLKINLGNQFNLFGYRQGLENGYVGNLSEKGELPAREGEFLFITQVFPNPAKDKTRLVWENYVPYPVQSLQLKISESTTGRIKWTQELPTTKGRHMLSLEVGNWPKGMYIISLYQDGQVKGEGSRLYVTE